MESTHYHFAKSDISISSYEMTTEHKFTDTVTILKCSNANFLWQAQL